jgi:hypothetical protein
MRSGNLFTWAFLLFLLVLGGLLFALRSYQVFTEQTLVATIQCRSVSEGSPYQFLLHYQPESADGPGATEQFQMYGDQWMVGGEILKWHPWLSLLRIRSGYKVTRINSRYLQERDEREKPRSVYPLNGGTDPLWQWLYRTGPTLPFVEAVYGNAAYIPAWPGTRWGLYVDLSGYLLKPLKEE